MNEAERIPGVVNGQEAYTVKEFRARMDLTQSAFDAMRRRGLPVKRCGKRCFVLGRDLLAFLEGLTTHARR